MGIFKSQKKMVVASDINFSDTSRRTDNTNARFCARAVYLCNILIKIVSCRSTTTVKFPLQSRTTPRLH